MKTKTFWVIIFMNLILSSNADAQDFKFGLVSGLDISNSRVTYNPNIEGFSRNYDPITSFNANGYIGYKNSRNWGISAEPGFIQKGRLMQKDNGVRMEDIKFKLNYIQLPILMDIYLSEKIFFSIGPEFAYMINAKLKSKESSNDMTYFYDNRYEISGMVGVNYNISKNFDFGLRYNHGLTCIKKTNYTFLGIYQQVEMKEYNQYFQFILRFKV